MDWQPIGTAPKDGTWVLGFQPRKHRECGIRVWAWNAFNSPDNLWVDAADSNDFDEQPTHWQPLPEPPAGEPK